MASRREQVFASFFVAWTQRLLTEFFPGATEGPNPIKETLTFKKEFFWQTTSWSLPAGLKLEFSTERKGNNFFRLSFWLSISSRHVRLSQFLLFLGSMYLFSSHFLLGTLERRGTWYCPLHYIQVTHHRRRKTLKTLLKTWVITFVPLFRNLLGTRPNRKKTLTFIGLCTVPDCTNPRTYTTRWTWVSGRLMWQSHLLCE